MFPACTFPMNFRLTPQCRFDVPLAKHVTGIKLHMSKTKLLFSLSILLFLYQPAFWFWILQPQNLGVIFDFNFSQTPLHLMHSKSCKHSRNPLISHSESPPSNFISSNSTSCFWPCHAYDQSIYNTADRVICSLGI